MLVRWDLSPASTDGSGEASQSFWTRAYYNLKQARDKVARRYDADRRLHPYQVGDTVVYHMSLAGSKARNSLAKLLLKWSKPIVIAKFIRPNVVLLANPDTGVIVRRAHISQLKAYIK